VLIGLLYDAPSLASANGVDDLVAVEGSLIQVDSIEHALARLGHRCRRIIYAGSARALADDLSAARPEMVFQLVQGRDCARLAGLLDLLAIPYTGAGAFGLELTTDKVLSKDVLAARRIAVPAYATLDRPDDPLPTTLAYPLIVKLRFGDNSVGIDDGSVVRSRAALQARARRLFELYGEPLIVEQYVDGREISVSLLGNAPALEILPLRENDFSGFPPGVPRIMSFAAKWLEASVPFNSVEIHCPIELEPALQGAVERAAVVAFEATGCRDYARVDFRVDRDGTPRVMEVNANPDLQLDGGFTTSALESGRTYDRIVADVLVAAQGRRGARLAALAV
jgi:D-alanine-D-alanine ligase